MKKPKLTRALAAWLCEVDEHVRRYDCRGSSLREAFSDVHDGNLEPDEVKPLVSQGVLRWIPISDPGPGNGLLGDRLTVDFTDRGSPDLLAGKIVRQTRQDPSP